MTVAARVREIARRLMDLLQWRNLLDHCYGDVRYGAEPVATRQNLLSDGQEPRGLTDHEANGRDEIVLPSVLGIGFVEVEPGIAPCDEDHDTSGYAEGPEVIRA